MALTRSEIVNAQRRILAMCEYVLERHAAGEWELEPERRADVDKAWWCAVRSLGETSCVTCEGLGVVPVDLGDFAACGCVLRQLP